jgi:hypothetical protein
LKLGGRHLVLGDGWLVGAIGSLKPVIKTAVHIVDKGAEPAPICCLQSDIWMNGRENFFAFASARRGILSERRGRCRARGAVRPLIWIVEIWLSK